MRLLNSVTFKLKYGLPRSGIGMIEIIKMDDKLILSLHHVTNVIFWGLKFGIFFLIFCIYISSCFG